MEVRESLRNQFHHLENLSISLRYPYKLLNLALRCHHIPVLMYHKITEHSYYDPPIPWSVLSASFNKQMEYLYKHNYTPLNIQEYIGYLSNRKCFPKKSLLITFDDGYRNVRRLAYITLKKYRFPAVLFVACKYIGRGKKFPWDREISSTLKNISNELIPLTWEEIKEMQDLVSVGSHTISHAHLSLLSQEDIHYEVSESKKLIEQRLGKEVLSFAYPGGIRRYGDLNDLTHQALIKAGYKIAFNSEIGRNGKGSNPYLQNRIYVEGRDSISLFESKLVGAYDWCRIAQWSFQKVFGENN